MKKIWLRLNVVALIAVLVTSLIYYYVDYYHAHNYYGFLRPIPHAQPGEGHHLSQADEYISDNIETGEVIIHYSDPYLRICSFYASLYYNQRAFPEHIYSKLEIAEHNGRQYLKPNEWIRSLSDLDPQPDGVWLVSLNDTQLFFDEDVVAGKKRPFWIFEENLPHELHVAGFEPVDFKYFGKVHVIYFRRGFRPYQL